MSENPFGRSSTHVVPQGQQNAGHEPAFDRSVGTSRRGTVWASAGPTVEQLRDPTVGLPSQEIMSGTVPNQVQRMDQGGKTFGVHTVIRSPITEPDGRTPWKGGEVTTKHIIDVAGVGQMRVRDALVHGLVKPSDLNMPESAAPTKSVARQRGEQVGQHPTVDPQAAQEAQVDEALTSDYNAAATELDKVMTSVGVSSENVLDQLAKGDAQSLTSVAAKVADKMGAEPFSQAVEALTLHTYSAVDRALAGTGAGLDDVLEVLEQPANSRRWGQCYSMYLRSGDATLLTSFAREVARGIGR